MLGGDRGMWMLSYPKHNETGARPDSWQAKRHHSLVVTEAMKYSLGRQRPNEGNGSGPSLMGRLLSFRARFSGVGCCRCDRA